ncbi:MAG: hypothetical protein ACYC7A_02970 [Thermoanaerobaculia bacterium]
MRPPEIRLRGVAEVEELRAESGELVCLIHAGGGFANHEVTISFPLAH